MAIKLAASKPENKTNINQVYTHNIILLYNIHGTVTCIYYYDLAFSLKMAFMAKPYCGLLLINKAVYRLDVYMFYLLAYLKHNGDPLPKNHFNNYYCCQLHRKFYANFISQG